MWSSFVDATEGMTDYVLKEGEIVHQITYNYSEKQNGFSDDWKYISKENTPPDYVTEWVNKNIKGFNGVVNVQYRGPSIIEVGLRDGEKMFEELLISGNEEKTSNSRIFKSNESFVTHEELDEIIKDMSDAIIKNDTNKITKIMTKYVDGFNYE